MFDSDLIVPYDELVRLLLCKYELCRLFCDADDINGDVYRCDETVDAWLCVGPDDDDEDTADPRDGFVGACKSYFGGVLRLADDATAAAVCIFASGE